MASLANDRLTIGEVRRRLAEVDPSVMIVEPRILGRVVRQDRRISGLGVSVPHADCYTISSDRLLMIVERSEIHLSPSADLPANVILLAAPADSSEGTALPAEEILHHYWRRLFHARVHVALERQIDEGRLTEEQIASRIRGIGETEFAEIHSVLQREDRLLPPRLNRETYVEFAALFLELAYFVPEDLDWYFPSLRDREQIEQLLQRDLDHGALFVATRPQGARAEWERTSAEEPEAVAPDEYLDEDPLRPSPPAFWRLLAGAERAGTLGNRVQAAILRMRAVKLALADRIEDTRGSARAELERLVARLREVLHLTGGEVNDWVEALDTLLPRAARGFWEPEARLLYDLQKVCIEQERGVFSLDLVEWARSRGRVPIRRPLPLLREVLLAKHLRTALRRLKSVRLPTEHRDRLQQLLEMAHERVAQQMRDRVGPRIAAVLDEVGLTPGDLPERVARQKLKEELLDRIADRGFLTMGDLRDALSKNNLKLPDLSGAREFLRGDPLLRADSKLARELDGIYHRGAVYQRFPQRFSSLAFGTRIGRFITSYVALPYGCAFLAIEFLIYLYHLATQQPNAAASAHTWTAGDLAIQTVVGAAEKLTATVTAAPFSVGKWIGVIFVGTFFLFLMHNAWFRRRCWDAAVGCGRILKLIIVDWPAKLLRSPLVQQLLQSVWYRILRGYLIKPALCSLPLVLFAYATGPALSWSGALNIFLAVNLFLNSPIGRYADEWLTDLLVRTWRELQARVVGAIVRFVIDLFQQILEALERVMYWGDEWLRFRRGERRLTLVLKAILGVAWHLVTYIVRFCITLLIEPQFNPIKHFPVVTVSHKLLAPWLLTIAGYLNAFLGGTWAVTVAAAIVFVAPGIPGFLVWEFKENWRLYAANRRRKLVPTPIGSHGETMIRLLRPGFHSGTLWKLFARLRRAAEKSRSSASAAALLRQKEKLEHCRVDVERFVNRELLELLRLSTGWNGEAIGIAQIRLATNRIEIFLELAALESEPVTVVFEERNGWLVAYLRHLGWLEQLAPRQRRVFAAGLMGLYKISGVNFVVEQVIDNFEEPDLRVVVAADHLLLESQRLGHARAHYRLDHEQPILTPEATIGLWPALELRNLSFARVEIPWSEWVAFWERDQVNDMAPLWLPERSLLSRAAATAERDNHEPSGDLSEFPLSEFPRRADAW